MTQNPRKKKENANLRRRYLALMMIRFDIKGTRHQLSVPAVILQLFLLPIHRIRINAIVIIG